MAAEGFFISPADHVMGSSCLSDLLHQASTVEENLTTTPSATEK